MPRYSDAALLKGEYTHMAAELRAGERAAPSPADWQKTSCDNAAEASAQAVAKQIFELQSTLDAEKEQLEISAWSAAGAMIVLGMFPGEGDMVRLEGHLINNKQPVALLTHATQLALTITKRSTQEVAPEEDATQIGFVIFDQLANRGKANATSEKKSKPSKPTEKTKKKTTPASKTKATRR